MPTTTSVLGPGWYPAIGLVTFAGSSSPTTTGPQVFGALDNNRVQFNGVYFSMLEKDTNSGLNRFDTRHQNVYIGNVFRQDFIRKGYTIQGSFHYNDDRRSVGFDRNGFLVRPALIGDVRPHAIKWVISVSVATDTWAG